jgi:oxygen-independent coproporphyrinogen-3 oxidase
MDSSKPKHQSSSVSASEKSAVAFLPDLDSLESLLPRYEMAGPRYTSYPTAPAWQEKLDPTSFREILTDLPLSETTPHAVYVHVPFCQKLCHFCACNRVITQKAELPTQYLATIAKEIKEVRSALPANARSGQIHLGGGTPTHLTPPQLGQLMESVLNAFPTEKDAEISIEIDPRVTTLEHMDALKTYGFNRISMGIQDFDPTVQDAVHRKQSVAEVNKLVEKARKDDVDGINFDLIYGLPHQNKNSFRTTLNQVISIRPDRIALYGYAHVTWVAKQQRGFERIDLPSASARLSLFIQATEQLLEAGYIPIGMDHFVLPTDDLAKAIHEDRVHRNFMGYTTKPCGELFAFGPSGISEFSLGFVQNARELTAWEESVHEHGVAAFRGHRLSEDDKRRAWVISQIMCGARVSATKYQSVHAESFRERFESVYPHLEVFEQDGLLEIADEGGFTITPTGRMFLRNIAMPFDAYLPDQQSDGKRIFSRTV